MKWEGRKGEYPGWPEEERKPQRARDSLMVPLLGSLCFPVSLVWSTGGPAGPHAGTEGRVTAVHGEVDWPRFGNLSRDERGPPKGMGVRYSGQELALLQPETDSVCQWAVTGGRA